jgi:Na+-transporting NADH:ubiquinone oxidoreductase subunit NqrB
MFFKILVFFIFLKIESIILVYFAWIHSSLEEMKTTTFITFFAILIRKLKLYTVNPVYSERVGAAKSSHYNRDLL